MEDNKEKDQDQVTFKDVFIKIFEWYKYLLSKWVIIVAFIFLGSGLGILYATYKKPIYISSSIFVLEESGAGAGGLGQYAGIASMVGIDLGSNGGGIFQGDNLLELYKSRNMMLKTLLTPVNIHGNRQLLIERYIEINNLKRDWDTKPSLKYINFNLKPGQSLTRSQDSLISDITDNINKSYLSVSKPDKKLSIIKVELRSVDEIFAKLFNDQIVKNVNDFYVQSKTKKSQDNLAVLQHQADSIRTALDRAISGVASSIDLNPNANLARQVLRVPSQRKQIDVQANASILQELVKNLEISKISLRKETPLIQMIDEPVYPLKREALGKFKAMVVGGILAGFIVSSWLMLRKFLKILLR